MGEVYRARDAKLGRDVAVKILPSSFAQDPERLARFEREALMIGSLNHPHVATVYGFEESNGVRALVMELVDGGTLAERIARGPLKLDEALAIARQIADGLDAAHEKGIVHRDLKPSNIAFTRDGVVKILDFGLAKGDMAQGLNPGVAQAPGPAAGLTHSPTLLAPTMTGVLLGTAPYMSPEQARGKPVDKRTDIWAFGCVLYEMLTGRRAFGGETSTDTVAAILERDPDWTLLPASTPPPVFGLLKRCLERNAKHRLRDIGDALLDDSPAERPAVGSRARLAWMSSIVVAVIAATALVWTLMANRSQPVPAWAADGAAFSIDPPQTEAGPAVPQPTIAVSRDGRFVTWVASIRGQRARLWLYSASTGVVRSLEGTDGAAAPFWSPDSRSIGFQALGNLKTIDVSSGVVKTLAPNPEVSSGGTWSSENVIVYSTRYTLQQLSTSGGEPRVVATLNPQFQENSLRYPRFLPDGRHFLYVARSGRTGQSGAYVGSIDGQAPRRLFAVTSHVDYSPPGYLLYAKDQSLVARRFDLRTFAAGEEEVILPQFGGADIGMRGHFEVSENGVLAFFARSMATTANFQWFDRSGRPLESHYAVGDFASFRLSPDGERVVVDDRTGSSQRDVWILNPGASRTRVTFGGSDDWQPFWGPGARSVAWMSYRDGPGRLYVKALDGATPEQPLISTPDRATDQQVPGDWSWDGRMIAYWAERSDTRGDVLIRQLDPPQTMTIAATAANERRPRFSPDGRVVAYESDESGRNNIYIQPVPPTGAKWQVSLDGGSQAAWRADGRELFFVDPSGTLTTVPIERSSGAVTVGAPMRLFSVNKTVAAGTADYDVAGNGTRFLVRQVSDPPAQPIKILLNWPARLARR